MSIAKLAFELSTRVGWPHTMREWEMMANAGSLLYIGDEKKISASAVLTHYSWGSSLGMVLVDPHEQRHGLGASITRQILSETQKADRPVVLTSSHAAKGLYSKMGFEQIGSVSVYEAIGNGLQPFKSRVTCTAAGIANKFYSDDPVRIKILENILNSDSPTICMKDKNGMITGFAGSITRITAQGKCILAVGPILAESPRSFGRLMDKFMSSTNLPIVCFAFQNFAGETSALSNSRKIIATQLDRKGFIKTDVLPFMSHGGRQVDSFLNPRIISPISLAFS